MPGRFALPFIHFRRFKMGFLDNIADVGKDLFDIGGALGMIGGLPFAGQIDDLIDIGENLVDAVKSGNIEDIAAGFGDALAAIAGAGIFGKVDEIIDAGKDVSRGLGAKDTGSAIDTVRDAVQDFVADPMA
jgi:hypothetical protein